MLLKSSARLIRRVLVTIAGVAVLGLGVALLALPGPGVLVIALGFLILSTEYEWARKHFESARKTAADLADQAVAKPWSTALSILASLGLIAAGFVWGSRVSAALFELVDRRQPDLRWPGRPHHDHRQHPAGAGPAGSQAVRVAQIALLRTRRSTG